MNKEWSELSKMMQVQINKEIERTYFLHSRTLMYTHESPILWGFLLFICILMMKDTHGKWFF